MHHGATRGLRLAFVAALFCSLLLGTGSLTGAAGPGPVFASIRASNDAPQAGDTVYLTVRLTSSADILGNPTVSYLFPDGTPGPTVSFSRVGGSLRDGEWQGTLPISQYVISGTYVVGELRAADVAGNVTVVTPDAELMNNATLTITNTALEPEDFGSLDEITMTTINKGITKPIECSSPHPNGPFFASVIFGNVFAPGASINVSAKIIDCDTSNYDFAGASIRMQYTCKDGRKLEGPLGTWVKTHGPPDNYVYKTTFSFPKPYPCDVFGITVKVLRAWDGGGYDNYFNADKPYWPVFAMP